MGENMQLNEKETRKESHKSVLRMAKNVRWMRRTILVY